MREDSPDGSGKVARTDYEVLSIPEQSPRKCSLLQLQPVTGTTRTARTVLFRLLATLHKQRSSQLIGQFGHVTASAVCKQPEKHGTHIQAPWTAVDPVM
jgi:hypothetical protein